MQKVNNSETLYTPLQINGCISENESNATQLYPRELYITKEGRLIVGNPKSTNQKLLTNTSELTVDTSLKSKSVEFTSGDYILDTATKIIKGFKIQSANIASANLGGSTIAVNNNTLQFNLNNGTIINGMITNSNLTGVKLNLRDASWGTELPKNPSVGDVFILI